MLFFLLSLFLSVATGFFLTRFLLPELDGNGSSFPLQIVIGAGLGVGLSSCVYFLGMITSTAAFIVPIDILLCLLALALSRKRATARTTPNNAAQRTDEGNTGMTGKSSTQSHLSRGSLFYKAFNRFFQKRTRLERLLLVIFFVELAAFCGAFLFAFLKEPHGRWDAWLIWNMHARFLARSGEAWRTVFSLPMDWSHWDYPLMLPLSVARGWKYAGGEGILIPAGLAFTFTLLTAGLLLVSTSHLKNPASGLAASMLLMATPFFILMGISQFADVPFSFFILASIVLLSLPENSGKNFGPLLLAGTAAGMCAWTKNEGILFFLVTGFVLFATTLYQDGWRRAAEKSGWFFAGALPALLCVIYFKLRLAPPNDLTTGFSDLTTTLAKLTDPDRYITILKNFLVTGLNFTQGPVDLRAKGGLQMGAVSILLPVVWLLLMGIERDRKARPAILRISAILILMLLGYFAVYLLTPLPLAYHLATSLNRLYLQLWPSVIFLFFMAAARPEGGWGWIPEKPALQANNQSGRHSSPSRKKEHTKK